jgi:ACR3 family arsenite efflux pump ArsB
MREIAVAVAVLLCGNLKTPAVAVVVAVVVLVIFIYLT